MNVMSPRSGEGLSYGLGVLLPLESSCRCEQVI